MPKKHQKNKRSSRKSGARRARAEMLVLPTEPNQYGSTALIRSDFNAALSKALAPYNTIGNQNFFWRATSDNVDQIQFGSGDASFTIFIAFVNVPGSSDFAAVFDQYRLQAVSVQISPRSGPIFPAGSIQPRLWTAIDYDDASPASRTALEQYDTCVLSPPGTGVVRSFVPRMALAAYSGAFTSYANMRDQWIDMASTGVQHYGLKAVIEGANTGQTVLQNYAVSVTSYWEFRATR